MVGARGQSLINKGNIMKTLLSIMFASLLLLPSYAAFAQEDFSKHFKYPPDSVIQSAENSYINKFLDPQNFKRSSLKCGLQPLPPLGCTVGSCVCDSNGENCQWTFICN